MGVLHTVRRFIFRDKQGAQAPERKESAASRTLVIGQVGITQYHDWDWRNAAREGYQENPIVYSAIARKAQDAASIPLAFFDGDEELEPNHPLVKLMARPNETQNGREFRQDWHTQDNIAGNVFTESMSVGKQTYKEPRYLYVQPSHTMYVVPGADNITAEFELRWNGKIQRGWPRQSATGDMTARFPNGRSNMLHSMRPTVTYDNEGQRYGQSPLHPCARAVDFLNLVYQWTVALCENGGRLSGMLTLPNDMSEQSAARLRENWENVTTGSSNAGRTITAPDGAKYTELGLSPKDVDWQNGKHSASRDVALTLGIPAQKLGIPGDSTYNNMQQANEDYWDSTVIPEAQSFVDAMNAWLCPLYGENVHMELKLDAVQALAARRTREAGERDKLTYLSINEKRAAHNLEPLQGEEFEQPLIPTTLAPAGMPRDDAVADMVKDLMREGHTDAEAKTIAGLAY